MLYPKKSPARVLQERNEKKKIVEKQREVLSHLISSSVLDTNPLTSSISKPLSLSQVLKSADIVSPNSKKHNNSAVTNSNNEGYTVNATQPQSLAVSLVVNELPQQTEGNIKQLDTPTNPGDIHNDVAHKSETLSELERYLAFLEQQDTVPDKELAFLNEKDEWLGLEKYLNYLKDQDDKNKKRRKETDLSKLKEDRAEQISLKISRKKEKQVQDQAYLDFLKAQLEEYKKKVKNDELVSKEKLRMEKEYVKKQIDEHRAKRKLERFAEKEFDSKYIEKNKQDLDQMASDKLQRKAFLMDYKDELYRQRIKDSLRKGEISQRDKLESLEMIKNNVRKMEEQEREYLEEAQARLIKFKEFQTENDLLFEKNRILQEKAKQTQQEQRTIRRENLKAKAEEENKRQNNEKKNKDRVDLSSMLKSQLETEMERKKNDKTRNNDQAVLWKMEREEFEKKERENKERKLEMYKKNQEDLLLQIKEKEEKKKNKNYKMSEEETKINSKLLEDMRALRHQKHTSLQGIFN